MGETIGARCECIDENIQYYVVLLLEGHIEKITDGYDSFMKSLQKARANGDPAAQKFDTGTYTALYHGELDLARDILSKFEAMPKCK